MISLSSRFDNKIPHMSTVVINSHKEFEQTAALWTKQFGTPLDDSAKVDKLCAMGFDKARATAALKACNGDDAAALEKLLGA